MNSLIRAVNSSRSKLIPFPQGQEKGDSKLARDTLKSSSVKFHQLATGKRDAWKSKEGAASHGPEE